MGEHSSTATETNAQVIPARVAAVRRARVAAWIVFLSMAGTTMTFQVYHSFHFGHMPWWGAALYGIVPLLISICILEIVAEWGGAPPWALCGAYAIMGVSMFLSAEATGQVVLHAAPPHAELLFGLLLDAAALLAVHFILSGPRPAVLAAQARAAREAIERAENDERNRLRTEVHSLRSELEVERGARETAETACAEAVAKAEITARKLSTATARRRPGNPARKRGPGNARKPEPAPGPVTPPADMPPETAPEDLDSEAKVLWYLDRGCSASKAGIYSGLTDSRGRQIARLAKPAPRNVTDGETTREAMA